jgi:hypothetical protein
MIGTDDQILLRWTCEMCGLSRIIPAPGYFGDGYHHYDSVSPKCGPLVARRVPGFLRARPGASDEEIQAIIEERAR